MTESNEAGTARPARHLGARVLPWLITVACFAFLYSRLSGAARWVGP